MRKWILRPASDEAAIEAASFFEDLEIKRNCMRLLNLLAQEENPGHPKNLNLNVKWVEHDAPTWYRLRVQWNKEDENGEKVNISIRIFFSLMYASRKGMVEYQAKELPFDNADNYISIEQIGYRSHDTYKEARRRWRKSRRK